MTTTSYAFDTKILRWRTLHVNRKEARFQTWCWPTKASFALFDGPPFGRAGGFRGVKERERTVGALYSRTRDGRAAKDRPRRGQGRASARVAGVGAAARLPGAARRVRRGRHRADAGRGRGRDAPRPAPAGHRRVRRPEHHEGELSPHRGCGRL